MPLDENEPQAQRATEQVAVIYCTLCGNRSAHAVGGGFVTTTWRMTAQEIRTMRRELPKMRCVYCAEPLDIRVIVEGEGPLGAA
jgi:hypothetical protein